jgi:hypothetical protein
MSMNVCHSVPLAAGPQHENHSDAQGGRCEPTLQPNPIRHLRGADDDLSVAVRAGMGNARENAEYAGDLYQLSRLAQEQAGSRILGTNLEVHGAFPRLEQHH